jgi:hypothetical protein
MNAGSFPGLTYTQGTGTLFFTQSRSIDFTDVTLAGTGSFYTDLAFSFPSAPLSVGTSLVLLPYTVRAH